VLQLVSPIVDHAIDAFVFFNKVSSIRKVAGTMKNARYLYSLSETTTYYNNGTLPFDLACLVKLRCTILIEKN